MGENEKQPPGWRQALLSSGIPLEHSVRQCLSRRGVPVPSSYAYERENREGRRTVFSVDVHGKYEPQSRVRVEYFVECKYAHPGKFWVFSPDAYAGQVKGADVFVVLDDLVSGARVDDQFLARAEKNALLAWKGLEVDGKSGNPNAIREGLEQLRYAVVDRAVDVLKQQMESKTSKIDRTVILFPILVTTAKLWRINDAVTLEAIADAAALDEVATECDLLAIWEQPDNQMAAHTSRLLREKLGEATLGGFGEGSRYSRDGRTWVEWFAANMPRVFLVVRHSYFDTAIDKNMAFFGTSAILRPK